MNNKSANALFDDGCQDCFEFAIRAHVENTNRLTDFVSRSLYLDQLSLC